MSIEMNVRRAESPSQNIIPISWPPAGFTTEILRLLLIYPHADGHLEALGLGVEDIVASHFMALGEPGTEIFALERSRRLEGLIHLAPESWPSVLLQQHVWSIRRLILSPDAPAGALEDLVARALDLLASPVDFLSARIPASDRAVIRGLERLGFRPEEERCTAVFNLGDVELATQRSTLVSIVPMQVRHMNVAATMFRDCDLASSYRSEKHFDAENSSLLHHMMLFRYLQDPDARVMVAESRSGDILGIVGCRLEPAPQKERRERYATMGYLGVIPELAGSGLVELLNAHAFRALWNMGARTVSIDLPTSTAPGKQIMASLVKIGYRLTGRRIGLHLWLDEYRATRSRAVSKRMISETIRARPNAA